MLKKKEEKRVRVSLQHTFHPESAMGQNYREDDDYNGNPTTIIKTNTIHMPSVSEKRVSISLQHTFNPKFNTEEREGEEEDDHPAIIDYDESDSDIFGDGLA